MITYFIIVIFLGLVGALTYPISFLPDATLPTPIQTSLTALGTYLSMASSFIPNTVIALIAILTAVIVVDTAVLGYKGINWVIRKIPGIS